MRLTIPLKWILVILLTLWASNAQSDMLMPGAREISQSAKDGFRPTAELTQAYEHLNIGNFEAAFEEVSRVLTFFQPKLETSRRARFVAAMGLLLRADIRVNLRHAEELILEDEKAAAELGSRRGYYSAAARTLVLSYHGNYKSTKTPLPSREAIEASFRAAAALGDLDAAMMLEQIAQDQGNRVEQTYWGFIRRFNRDKALLAEQFVELKSVFSNLDMKEMREGVEHYGLTSDPSIATLNNLPSRSVFTVYQLDHQLRKRLEFIWRAFFNDTRERGDSTVLDSYLALKPVIADGVISDLYLLVPGGSRAKLPKLVAIPRPDVTKFISSGDEIAVRCGSDDHQASVWRVDREAGLVYLLDPFYEFWTPEQTSCTPSFRHTPYKYRRHLVSIKLDELKPMVLAIFTVRDAREK